VTVLKHFFELWQNRKRRGYFAQKTERRLKFDFISQNCAFRVRQNDVAVSPRFKRTGNLHIFKFARRFLFRMLGDPLFGKNAENLNRDNRPLARFQTRRGLNYSCILPRRRQTIDSVRQFVKRENSFRRGFDN
jgi:hypothetical protein